MSARDALKALSSRYPLPDRIAAVLQGMEDKGDRETVIVTGALTEPCLQRSLMEKLELNDNNLIGHLFKNRGPLTEFHNKILCGST